MAEPSFADQVSTLNSTLRAIEVRLALGRAPVEGLEDFKSALDDMRLRLWGLLGAAGGEDYRDSRNDFGFAGPPRCAAAWVVTSRQVRSADVMPS